MDYKKYVKNGTDTTEAEKDQQKESTGITKNQYMRIGILVVIILILAVVSSLYIDVHSGCSAVYSTQRNSCFENLALSTGNATMCHNIVSGQLQNQCLDSVALKTKNASLCNSINSSSIAYGCDYNVSLSTQNESVCSTINNASENSECRYSFAEANKFGSESYCKGISNTTLYGYCSNQTSYNKAIITGDASYCSGLNPNNGEGVPAITMLEDSGLNTSTNSYLNFYEDNSSDLSVCYYSIAVKFSNKSLCSDVQGGLGEYCDEIVNTSVTPVVENMSYVSSTCNATAAYGGSIAINSCIISFAVSYHNETYCNIITNKTISNNCVARVQNYTNTTT